MALPNIFSRRKRQEAAASSDVFIYNDLPNKLRVQIVHIWAEAIGGIGDGYQGHRPKVIYEQIVQIIRKEKGVFELIKPANNNAQAEFYNWFLTETDVDFLLDAVELSFRFIDTYIRGAGQFYQGKTRTSPDAAIEELNARMLEAQVGFQYEKGDIIRVDSLYIHKEVVVPALRLLSHSPFDGANAEFLEAHRFYREADYEQSLTECCKAFESVLKTIGHLRAWPIHATDSASRLLQAAFNSPLIPPSMQAEFSALKSLLESGVPTVRNRNSGHGTGPTPRVIPQHLAEFQMHQTAAAIVFLVEAHNATP